jgi:hypothetical protein
MAPSIGSRISASRNHGAWSTERGATAGISRDSPRPFEHFRATLEFSCSLFVLLLNHRLRHTREAHMDRMIDRQVAAVLAFGWLIAVVTTLT